MYLLEKALTELGLAYDTKMIDSFRLYMERIIQINEKVNLTAITDQEEFLIKHFVDSLSCLEFEEVAYSKRIIDVGTGAGFPGMPLAIISKDKEFVLADSLNKRVKALKQIVDELEIKNVEVIHSRAEDLAKMPLHRERFDLALARAVAPLRVLSEYCLPFVKVGGCFGALKSGNMEDEIKEAQKAFKLLGGRHKRTVETIMSKYGYKHKIVFIEKVNSTNEKYPRKAGVASKAPL